MAEKKLVIDGIRFNYSGMFDIKEFFKEIEDWTDENGFERETKKKLQHVEADGKKMDYIFELWKRVEDWARVTVRLRVLFRDVVDFDMERKGYKRTMQKGKCVVIIDGFVETNIQARWQQKPWFVFVRTLYDKLVWKHWVGRWDGVTASACNDLYKKLFEYFKKYKY